MSKILAPMSQDATAFVMQLNRQPLQSQFRARAIALGIALGIAKSLQPIPASNYLQAESIYVSENEITVRGYLASINELQAIDHISASAYTKKFFCFLNTVNVQAPITMLDATVSTSVLEAATGASKVFSPDELKFMEEHKRCVLEVAAATAAALSVATN